jgi:hypothetical protein
VPLLAAGCAHPRAADGDVVQPPSQVELAMRCARATAQAGGFQVRLPDPREPWLMIADWRGANPSTDRIVIRILPGGGPDDRPHIMATVEGPRSPSGARTEATETALRIESRCGAGGGTP